jgi:hypothetical protein
MALDREKIMREILTAIGEAELERVKKLIGSETLRRAIFLAVYATLDEAKLIVPHYWAVYYHDGRGSVTPRAASKLIFFDDPLENDPRLQGAYDVRASDIQRLTRDQYEEGLARNAERRAQGLPPFMFVVDAVGPSRPRPFFDQLSNNAANRAGPTVLRIFDRHIQDLVQTDEDVRPERGIADLSF